MHQINADHNTKYNGSKEGIIILQYKMYGKVQKKYQYMCQEGYNTLCWYFPNEYIDYLDTPDAGAGNNIKFWFGVYLYEWLWESENLDIC